MTPKAFRDAVNYYESYPCHQDRIQTYLAQISWWAYAGACAASGQKPTLKPEDFFFDFRNPVRPEETNKKQSIKQLEEKALMLAIMYGAEDGSESI